MKQGSAERVEFALKLPGSKDGTVWLPIDAKFPQEDFQRLLEAREQADTAAADIALKQLERRLKSEARDIQNKYLCPPQTTDFAIMYLPIEGLFAEAVNLPGLLDIPGFTFQPPFKLLERNIGAAVSACSRASSRR